MVKNQGFVSTGGSKGIGTLVTLKREISEAAGMIFWNLSTISTRPSSIE